MPNPAAALPAVDVIIATHNRPELLKLAMDAVVAQTYEGVITVTVVFDQSEPDLSLASDDAARPIRVVANTERTPGLAGARNTGILASNGELVAFCDDDDEWQPTKAAKQVAALQADPAALSCVTGITITYKDHTVDRVPSQEELTVTELVRNRVMPAHPSTVMVRRDALAGPIGLVDEQIPGSFGEDYDWIIRAAQAGPVTVVPEALTTVRWGLSLFSQKWATIIEALDYLVAKHPEFRQDPRAIARIDGQRAFAMAALGRRREALREAWRTARENPRERRAYLAGAVAIRAISAKRVMDLAHSRGRGI
jgi:glycosyltransferase involved in cell wall biosynthesis